MEVKDKDFIHCDHNVCVYVEDNLYIDFYTEDEIYRTVWQALEEKYNKYICYEIDDFDFSARDYVEEHCNYEENNFFVNEEPITCFIELDYCPDCGLRLDWVAIKLRINKKIYNNLCNLSRERKKKEPIVKNNKKKKAINSNDGYVYLVKLDKNYKIGISITPESRLKEFTLLPYPLEEICIKMVKNYRDVEIELHEQFADKRVRGEWFELDENDINFIKDYLSEREISE